MLGPFADQEREAKLDSLGDALALRASMWTSSDRPAAAKTLIAVGSSGQMGSCQVNNTS
jgi:hypothetical protein